MHSITCWGDGLTAGVGKQRLLLSAYPYQLQMLYGLRRRVHQRGVGGETSSQILARFQAEPSRHKDTTIIWAGRNNSAKPDEVLRDLGAIIARLSHGRFLVLTIINSTRETVGTELYEVQMEANRRISDTYDTHVVDARAALVAISNGTSDTIASDWTLDGLHLSRKAMSCIAHLVKDQVDRRGW